MKKNNNKDKKRSRLGVPKIENIQKRKKNQNVQRLRRDAYLQSKKYR